MKPSSNQIKQIVLLAIIVVVILALLVFKPGSAPKTTPIPQVQKLDTTFDTNTLQNVQKNRDNNYPPVTFTDLGKANPFGQ